MKQITIKKTKYHDNIKILPLNDVRYYFSSLVSQNASPCTEKMMTYVDPLMKGGQQTPLIRTLKWTEISIEE
jgi:hypothetical protein